MMNISEEKIREIAENIVKEIDSDGSECISCPKLFCAGDNCCLPSCPDRLDEVVSSGCDRISASLGIKVRKEIAGMIDHTLLKPDATLAEIEKLCEEARNYCFASVCINPGWVKIVSRLLEASGVKTCTVIGFPLGATTSLAKSFEAREALSNGADEIDMVMNIGAMKSRDYSLVENDINAVVQAGKGAVVKVILETGLLTDEEKVIGSKLSKAAGADFVKTSTGFAKGGATVEDVQLMRETVGRSMGVKASGGVRDQKTARSMLKAGASRIGASASIAIVKGDSEDEKGY